VEDVVQRAREVVGKVSELRVLVVLSIGTLQSRQVVLHRLPISTLQGAFRGHLAWSSLR
jgi:hypothetical protein